MIHPSITSCCFSSSTSPDTSSSFFSWALRCTQDHIGYIMPPFSMSWVCPVVSTVGRAQNTSQTETAGEHPNQTTSGGGGLAPDSFRGSVLLTLSPKPNLNFPHPRGLNVPPDVHFVIRPCPRGSVRSVHLQPKIQSVT